MTTYPSEITYNHIRPKGFFSTFKEWTIQPTSNNGMFWPGGDVRIAIQSVIAGVMDPYRSHIQFEVEVDKSLLPVGLLQIDSSAQSFIENMVITSKNKEVQRIHQYSVLAAWLTDIGLSQLYAEGRQTQGLGYSNVQSINSNGKPNSSPVNFGPQYLATNSAPQSRSITGLGSILPTQTGGQILARFDTAQGTISKSNTYSNIKGHITSANSAWLVNDRQVASDGGGLVYNRSIQSKGYIRNFRADYAQNMQSQAYCDSTSSLPTTTLDLDRKVFTENGAYTPLATWTQGKTYDVSIPQTITYNQSFGNSGWNMYDKVIPNITSLHGFTSLYSPNFCKGVRQPFISATVPQCQMRNGRILPQKIPIAKRTFKVPLISAILGLLIPQDQFVLLPIRALDGILIQLILDKFAMFTSGYNDVAEYDTQGMKLQQLRAFSFRKITYKMHTYQFFDPSLDEYLSMAMMQKILLNVNMWSLGNQHQIAKGENANGTFQFGCSAQALNEVVILFVPLDHQHYSFCRKHFRISNNLTKFQLRVAMEYYPSQPLVGNGGNPCQIDGLDNSAFVQQIFWSNNFMFNQVNPWPRINAHNFAINQRCYDPTRRASFYDPKMLNDQINYQWTDRSVNQDTAMGMPWIHQNRYVGKAGYVFSFEPYAHSQYHLTGLDCRNLRQVEVSIATHPSDAFPREQIMYGFMRTSCIIEYGMNGVVVYGR